MTPEVLTPQETSLAQIEKKPLTVMEVKAQINRIQEIMKHVMKKDVHYGTIPGTPKPTLYKPGAEKLLSTFRISDDVFVEDLSSPDCIRYRVTVKGCSIETGVYLGSGVGECSSEEEKYQWRKALPEEFKDAQEDRKREKWFRGRDKNYKVQQVRTNPADQANTVLKMAKKRAKIDLTLSVLACSDIFEQDLEDMPEEQRPQENTEGQLNVEMPKRKSEAQANQTPAPNPSEEPKINEAQRRRFYALYKKTDKTEEEVKKYLKETFNVESTKDIPLIGYDMAATWAEDKTTTKARA